MARPLRTPRAFTLVELLAALVIGTMILAASASVFVTTLDMWDRGSRRSQQTQAAEKIGALIERHLRAAESPALDQDAVFVGEDLSLDDDHPGHLLTLRSTAPGRFPRAGEPVDACEIAFEYDPSGEDGMTMRIQSPPDDEPDDGGYRVQLSMLVRGFRVRYYDGQDWRDSWSANRLPEAVEFTLLIDRMSGASSATGAPGSADAGAADDADAGYQAGSDTIGQGPLVYTRLVWLPAAQAAAPQGNGGSGSGNNGNGNARGNRNANGASGGGMEAME